MRTYPEMDKEIIKLLDMEGMPLSVYAARVIENLQAENAELKKRLENAVELPCIEPMTTWDWDATTGLGKTNFGKYWKVLYRDEDGEFIAYMGATKEEAEAMLKEMKEKNND